MFNEFVNKILKECDGGITTDGGVYGNTGPYDTGNDNRIPKVMGPMVRRLNKRRKRKKHQ